ncbi:MAG: DNA primase [bacterium]
MSSDGTIEEIKRRLDIAEVVGDYLQLKRAGTSLKACCPFHQEKSPSFFVNPERQIYHCFGCGEGGDIFEFVQKMEGLEFPDALRLLAGKAGVTLERRADDGQRSERRRLLEANALAARLYHKLLLDDPRAAAAREYVERRALSRETVEDFLLGYAPDSWDATSKFLMSRGFSDGELARAGLTSRSDRGSRNYDRFRGRLMFPIRDVHGEVVGFTARVLPGPDGRDPDGGPKYVNTPQTPVYDKSRALYGINLAKQHIRRESVAVIVEGNMDVIASHQAGVRNVVASSGTALTVEQLDLLRRFTDRLVLSFDADSAGESAARRGIDAAVGSGFSVRMLRLPEGAGKDPDDCIRRDVELWKGAIADAVPYMSWYLRFAAERTDFADAESKRRAAGELLQEIVKMPDQVERSHWIGELSRMFSTPEALLFEQLRRMVRPPSPSAGRTTIVQPEQNQPVRKERELICAEHLVGMALVWPELVPAVLDGLPPHLPPVLAELYSSFREFYTLTRTGGESPPVFRTWLEQRGKSEIARQAAVLELQAEREFGELSPESRQAETGKLLGELKMLQTGRRRQELVRAMATAEKNGDLEKIQQIQRELGEMTA